MIDRLRQLAEILLACRGREGAVYLYPHVSVDGDALGSALALGLALEQAGIRFRLPLDEPVPPKLDFLAALDRIEAFSVQDQAAWAAGQQIGLAIDCSGAGRLGGRSALYGLAPRRLVLDHHIADGATGPDDFVDPSAAAVAELVFELIGCLEARLGQSLISPDVAFLLMSAIISDTGGFVYSNTSARTFRIAASLMRDDLDLRQITYRLFDQTSQERLRLMGRIFSEARFSHQGRVVLALVDQAMLDAYRATDHDLDGVIAYLRNVAGVDAAFLIRRQADGQMRVNVRSSGLFDSARFAARFGGGGHARAAGMTLTGMTLEEAGLMITREAGEQL